MTGRCLMVPEADDRQVDRHCKFQQHSHTRHCEHYLPILYTLGIKLMSVLCILFGDVVAIVIKFADLATESVLY